MIRNIIFDMGNVLLQFDPDTFIKRTGINDVKDIEILKREVYHSLEWAMMDRGTLTDKDASEIMKQRVPNHLKEYVSQLTFKWDRPIIPVDGAKELIQELKENGYKIYLLSNASLNQKNYWDRVPGSEFFDGVLISSEVKFVKPEHEIFQCLLDSFQLKKEECFFIDDSPLNVESANYFGIKAMVFHNDYSEVRKKLLSLDVNVKEDY